MQKPQQILVGALIQTVGVLSPLIISRDKLNTMHLFRKNRISTVHCQSMIHILYFTSLVSDFGPF